VFGATFRLARYNITSEEPQYPKIFFGVPTTLAAGLLAIWFLALSKYAEPGAPMSPAAPFGGSKLFGDSIVTPAEIWRYLPLVMIVGGLVMASSLRMPKLGLMRSKLLTGFVFANVFAGYICAFARVFPEYLVWPPTLWLVTFLIWGQASSAARAMVPPRIFPPVDPPPGQEPIRPEDDLLPEGEDVLEDPGPQSASGVNSSSTPTG
jgi:phosphatidylserine synthase